MIVKSSLGLHPAENVPNSYAELLNVNVRAACSFLDKGHRPRQDRKREGEEKYDP